MGSIRRNALTAAATAGILLAAAPQGARAQDNATSASPATLTLPASDRGTRDYGEDRASRTFALALDADKPLPSAPAVTLGDARRSDGGSFKGTVNATTQLTAGRQVQVAVTVDPEDGVDDGTYIIPMHVRANEITGVDFRQGIAYSHTPSAGVRWLLAVLALLVGLSVGGALRWLSDKGTKLRDLLGRRDVLVATLGRPDVLPTGLRRDLAALDLLLAQGDAPRAEAKLGALEPALVKLLPALDALARARAEFTRQRDLIAALGPTPELAARLERVLAKEGELLGTATDEAWPTPDDNKDGRATLTAGIKGFSAFLAHFQTPESREAPAFQAALDLYIEGRLAEARAAWDQAAGDVASDAVAEQPVEIPAGPTTSRLSWWAARNAPILIGLATGFGLALVGLLTVFKPDAMFLTQDVRDVLVLIAWGFGSALTGMTLAQLAAKATGPAG